MEFGIIAFVIVVAMITFALIFMIISIYNGLIAVKENVNKSWANIDVILKQRYDEIPQLISICRQYVEFEQGMVDKLMSAREKMIHGKSVTEKAQGSSETSQALSGLLAVGEAYPELKSNNNFMQIQTRLSTLEETLADRREFYNDSVNLLNTRIQQFPDVLFANFMGMTRRDLFKVEEAEKKLPNLEILPRK